MSGITQILGKEPTWIISDDDVNQISRLSNHNLITPYNMSPLFVLLSMLMQVGKIE